MNPLATPHLPSFITGSGETDVLMVVTALVLLASVLGFGVLFLHLHTLPERIAHKSQKVQFEIVAILGLLALFTHMHVFWVAGLLLAFIDFPDLGGFLRRIAGSVEKIAGVEPGEGAGEAIPAVKHGDEPASAPAEAGAPSRKIDGAAPPPPAVKIVPAQSKETVRA
jgi:hypothetical protein